jgi:lipoyl-dependent peroxiredoxin
MKLSFTTPAGFDRRTEKNKDEHLSNNQHSSRFNPGSHEGAVHRKDPYFGRSAGRRLRSDDGRLDVKFSAPGVPGIGTNPEQLFAAGWSACFISAMGLVANRMKVKLPAEIAVDAEIDLCNSGDVYFLRARLNVSLLGLEREVAQAIVDATHGETCAYSNATRGNIDVTLNVV